MTTWDWFWIGFRIFAYSAILFWFFVFFVPAGRLKKEQEKNRRMMETLGQVREEIDSQPEPDYDKIERLEEEFLTPIEQVIANARTRVEREMNPPPESERSRRLRLKYRLPPPPCPHEETVELSSLWGGPVQRLCVHCGKPRCIAPTYGDEMTVDE